MRNSEEVMQITNDLCVFIESTKMIKKINLLNNQDPMDYHFYFYKVYTKHINNPTQS